MADETVTSAEATTETAAHGQPAPTTTEQHQSEAAKYTDQQVNDLIAKNTAKEVGKLLKDAGLESSGNAKQDLAAFKAWKESQMSESEKANARAKELETANAEAIARADRAEAKAEALARGVPSDKADKVVKLATSGVYEGENIAAKIAAVLDEFPDYINKGGPVFGSQTRTDAASAQDVAMQAARRAAGLGK